MNIKYIAGYWTEDHSTFRGLLFFKNSKKDWMARFSDEPTLFIDIEHAEDLCTAAKESEINNYAGKLSMVEVDITPLVKGMISDAHYNEYVLHKLKI
jgi:hypothetical protein